MGIVEPIISELAEEGGKTRLLLELIPEDAFSFKPHEKSMTMIQLGSHLAEILDWIVPTIQVDELSFNPAEYVPYIAESKEELLNAFDEKQAIVIDLLAVQADEHMNQNWKMMIGDHEVFNMPRTAVIRVMMLNHSIHHRGQLTVYLRLNDVPLPPLYGPTADNPMM